MNIKSKEELIKKIALALDAIGPNYDSLGRASDPGTYELAEAALQAIEDAGYKIESN